MLVEIRKRAMRCLFICSGGNPDSQQCKGYAFPVGADEAGPCCREDSHPPGGQGRCYSNCHSALWNDLWFPHTRGRGLSDNEAKHAFVFDMWLKKTVCGWVATGWRKVLCFLTSSRWSTVFLLSFLFPLKWIGKSNCSSRLICFYVFKLDSDFTWSNRQQRVWWRPGQQHQLLQLLPLSTGMRNSGLPASFLEIGSEWWQNRSSFLHAELWPDPEPGVCFGTVALLAADGSGTRCSSCCGSEGSGCCRSGWLFDLLSPLQMDWTWLVHLISLQKTDIFTHKHTNQFVMKWCRQRQLFILWFPALSH